MSAYEYATSEVSRDGSAPSDRGIEAPNVVQDPQFDPDWTAHGFVDKAADLATKSLTRVRSGDQMPAAALAALAQPIAAATEALKRVWLTHRAPMMGDEHQIQAWAKTEYDLDRLLAVVMQLLMASATPRDQGLGDAPRPARPRSHRTYSTWRPLPLCSVTGRPGRSRTRRRVSPWLSAGDQITPKAPLRARSSHEAGAYRCHRAKLAVLLTVFFDACTEQGARSRP